MSQNESSASGAAPSLRKVPFLPIPAPRKKTSAITRVVGRVLGPPRQFVIHWFEGQGRNAQGLSKPHHPHKSKCSYCNPVEYDTRIVSYVPFELWIHTPAKHGFFPHVLEIPPLSVAYFATLKFGEVQAFHAVTAKTGKKILPINPDDMPPATRLEFQAAREHAGYFPAPPGFDLVPPLCVRYCLLDPSGLCEHPLDLSSLFDQPPPMTPAGAAIVESAWQGSGGPPEPSSGRPLGKAEIREKLSRTADELRDRRSLLVPPDPPPPASPTPGAAKPEAAARAVGECADVAELDDTPETVIQRLLKRRINAEAKPAEDRYATWFSPRQVTLSLSGQVLTVNCATVFIVELLRPWFAQDIEHCASQITGSRVELHWHVDPELFRAQRAEQQRLDGTGNGGES